MTYRVIPPPPSLRPFVRFFWIFEGGPAGGDEYVYRSMADGCAELVFHYKGVFDELVEDTRIAGPRAVLHAQGRTFRRFATGEAFGIFGVYLYPFAVPHMLRLPATELSGTMLDLETLAGAAGRELEEQVMLAHDNAERIQIVSCFLEKALLSHLPEDAAVLSGITRLLHSGGTLPVATLASGVNLSPRQFERKVKEHAGLSPKLLSRIVRFQAAAAQYGGRDRKSLTEIGYECGYYDQSHFIRDFKEFSGYHPGAFFSGNAEGTDYRAA